MLIDHHSSSTVVIIFFIALLCCPVFRTNKFGLAMKKRPMNYLFIGTKTDIASMNIAKHVLQNYQWNSLNTAHLLQNNPFPISIPYPSLPPSSIASGPSYQISENQLFFYSPIYSLSSQEELPDTITRRNDRFFFWIIDHTLLHLNFPNKIFTKLLTNYFFPPSLTKEDSLFSVSDLKDTLAEIETEKEYHRNQCNVYFPGDLEIDEVFFVSKHAAASGTVSLTVHPIGIPHLVDCGRSGGIAGRCSPPSPHIGNLYRSILQETKECKLDQMFTITLEATHHGPFVEIPTCFIEIGSTQLQWENPIAGKVWASCLGKYFGFLKRPKADYHKIDCYFEHLEEFFKREIDQDEDAHGTEKGNEKKNEDEKEVQKYEPSKEISAEAIEAFLKEEETVLITGEVKDEESSIPPYQSLDITKGIALFVVGGGHYVPRMNDMARFGEGYHVGHALASYCLDKSQFQAADERALSYHPNDSLPTYPLPYQRILRETIQSMRIAYPDCRIGCLIDKKSFKGEEKDKITAFLNEEKIFFTYKTADIRKYNLSSPVI